MGLESLFFKRKEIRLTQYLLPTHSFMTGFAERYGERPQFAEIGPGERREGSYILGGRRGRDVKKRDRWPRGAVEGTDQHGSERAHDSGKRPSFNKGILR